MTTHKSVLLLTSPREKGWIDNTSNSVVKGLHTFVEELSHEGDIAFAVSSADMLDFRIDHGAAVIFDRYTGKDLRDYDIVHLRNVTLFADYARAIAIYMGHHGKRVIDEHDAAVPEYGKLSQMMLFALNGLPVPNTWATWHIDDTTALYLQAGDFPFILKANGGIKGQDNYLVRSQKQLDEIITAHTGSQFVAQDYIPNDKDYRVLWFADDALVFSRSATGDSHLNNTSQGGTSAELNASELDPIALEIARKAATLVKRSFSGADVMQNSETGEWYVLEVNANPALSSGDLLDKKRAAYKKMIGEML